MKAFGSLLAAEVREPEKWLEWKVMDWLITAVKASWLKYSPALASMAQSSQSRMRTRTMLLKSTGMRVQRRVGT